MNLPILVELEPRSIAKLKKIGLDPATLSSILNYVQYGVPVGDFLQAVVCNDLCASFGLADANNKELLEQLVAWFYWEVPGDCWKSKENYKAWVKKGFEAREKAEKMASQVVPSTGPVSYVECTSCSVKTPASPERRGLCLKCFEEAERVRSAEKDGLRCQTCGGPAEPEAPAARSPDETCPGCGGPRIEGP